MNLLLDSWIPIGEKQVSLQELLCTEHSHQIVLPRDDMEMACLQLIISLVQVIFLPENNDELKEYTAKPMAKSVYESKIKPYVNWFDLNHPETPFMQVRNVKAKEITPIQKLFVGLPEAASPSFFNAPGEIEACCEPCVAIAIFNQASNAPGFGGGFKGPLRGGAPISLLIQSQKLRETIWLNIVSYDVLNKALTATTTQPVWVEKIDSNSTLMATEIDLLKGLFWQPAHIELKKPFPKEKRGSCSFCGFTASAYYTYFSKEKFNFSIEGLWPHPHSSRQYKVTKGVTVEEKTTSFTTDAPTWTRLQSLTFSQKKEKDGFIAALNIRQFAKRFPTKALHISVGGYRTNQAKILERRHELLGLAQGWQDSEDVIEYIVSTGLEYKKILRNSLYFFVKGNSEKGQKGVQLDLHQIAEEYYYRATENLIYQTLRNCDFKQRRKTIQTLMQKCRVEAESIFDEITKPYLHDPRLLKSLAVARGKFYGGLKKIEMENL